MPFVTDLSDAPFGEVAQTVEHAADALYFNDSGRAAARPVALRENPRWSADLTKSISTISTLQIKSLAEPHTRISPIFIGH
ncbi:hypothetical protein FYJ91_06640 [Sphingomonas montanisoli]|uniref:Uncharacterized protein n=1 Tax=Sphingomonas montanisoli TaxID=2606412 RepID=A0A5D9C886_9SPHN|nr:hypothetical protein FYJ91_06640 [Sphingomonas montanisoli]